MEPQYISQAKSLFFSNEKIYIAIAPGYSAIIAFFYLFLKNWEISSQLIFIIFETLTCVVLFQWAKELLNSSFEVSFFLLMLVFFPSLTISFAGYSHCIAAGLFFYTAAIYSFWVLFKTNKSSYAILFSISMIFSIAIRPETLPVFCFLILLHIGSHLKQVFSKKVFKLFFQMLVFLLPLATFLMMHNQFVKERNISKNTSIFSDERYSYRTFTHIYCIKNNAPITDSMAFRLSSQKFGSPEENNYSVVNAIKKNPTEFLKNVEFNIIRMLKLMPHPLVLTPFIMMIGLFGIYKDFKRNKIFHSYLLLVTALSTGIYLLFHMQIKYLSNLSIPFLFWAVIGTSAIKNEKLKGGVASLCIISCFCVYLFYLIKFTMLGTRG